jgi:transposase
VWRRDCFTHHLRVATGNSRNPRCTPQAPCKGDGEKGENKSVEKGKIVSMDELMSYGLPTDDGYKHGAIVNNQGIWAYYDAKLDVENHTNSVESLWEMFKASVHGTLVHISAKHMQRYLNEFNFRANHRNHVNLMFGLEVVAL